MCMSHIIIVTFLLESISPIILYIAIWHLATH